MTKNLYIASCVESGGIYHYQKSGEEWKLCNITRLDRPMYMLIDHGKMYVILRAPFEEGESGVIVYDIDEEGRLHHPSEIMATHGEVACHLAVLRENVYCTNYISGSVCMLPDKLVQHNGKGIHPTRQEGPHTHYVCVTPDQKYICVTDLGLDTIFVYRLDLTLYSKIQLPLGQGIRHLAFSEDGKYLYAVNELKSTVAALSYQDGKLELLDVCSILPQNFHGESTAAAIRVKNGFIYASNRGHDSIAVLHFQQDCLEVMKYINCGGKTPRDFVIEEDLLYSANQDSNSVTIIDLKDDDVLQGRINVEMPVCVCVV